jgi:hypothetical protein
MPMELYFGLGDSTAADNVTVTWGDATTSDLGVVPGDQVLRLEPQEPAP